MAAHSDLEPAGTTIKRVWSKIEIDGENTVAEKDWGDDEFGSDSMTLDWGIPEIELEIVAPGCGLASIAEAALRSEASALGEG